MVTACNSGGSISKGPSEGLRMLEKEWMQGRFWGGEIKSNLTKFSCSALQIGLVLFRLSLISLLLSEETHQVKENRVSTQDKQQF